MPLKIDGIHLTKSGISCPRPHVEAWLNTALAVYAAWRAESVELFDSTAWLDPAVKEVSEGKFPDCCAATESYVRDCEQRCSGLWAAVLAAVAARPRVIRPDDSERYNAVHELYGALAQIEAVDQPTANPHVNDWGSGTPLTSLLGNLHRLANDESDVWIGSDGFESCSFGLDWLNNEGRVYMTGGLIWHRQIEPGTQYKRMPGTGYYSIHT